MSDQGDFVEGALHHVWGARAEQHLPGMSMTVRDGDVGFLTFYSDEYVKWSSIVKVDVRINAELLELVAEMNKGLPVGSLTVKPDGLIMWSYKVLPQWIDTDSRTSAQMLADVCTNVPNFVRMCRQRLENSGGAPYTPNEIGALMFL